MKGETMETAPLYELDGVSFDYRLGKVAVRALTDVHLQIPHHAFLCIQGPSGSGKSTLLALLGLIEAPQAGGLRMDGQDLRALREGERNALRRTQLGFVFQDYYLNPVLSGEENVEFLPARQGVPRAERRERVERALREVGMWERRRHRPLEMSGGERQRIAVARALAKQPSVILADEPTASLDSANGLRIVEILRAVNQARGMTVILASHDPQVAALACTVVDLHDGRVVAVSEGR
jgi:putative ABC transport system ATP-binding protein